METKILKSQGPGNFGPGTSPFWWRDFSLICFFVKPAIQCTVWYAAAQPNTRAQFQGARPASRGRPHLSRGVFTNRPCWDCFENSSLPFKTSPFGWVWLTHCVILLFRKTSANSHTNSTFHLGCLCRQKKNSKWTQRYVFYNIKWHHISSSKAVRSIGWIS